MSATAVELPSSSESPSAESTAACWQPGFLKMLPTIERDVRIAFRNLPGDHRDEAVQDTLCNACVAYASLAHQGRPEAANASSLARFAVAQYRAGRRVGSSLNVRDVLSPYCQHYKGVQVQSLSFRDRDTGVWREILVEDPHVTPADLAATRIDYPAFLASLGATRRQIAETLATGETTQHVAQVFGLSPARISQLRRELMEAWEQFHALPQEAWAAA